MTDIFIDSELIMQALRCSESANQKGLKDNKSLATIGDSLLSFVLLDIIRDLSITDDRGGYTNLKKIIQDNKTLNLIGKEIFKSIKIDCENNDLLGKKGYSTIL